MKIVFLNKYQNNVNRGVETFILEISKRLSKKHEVEVISEINYLKLFFNKFDLVIPTNGRFQAVLVRLISWLKGKKMIITGHSGVGFDDRINLYTFPNCFVALSTKARMWAKKVNPFVKVEKIPNGVDLKKFGNKGKKIVLNLQRPIILSVAAFTDWKRLDLTIKAVSKLEKGSLLIIGRGPEENKLQKLAEKLIPGRFKILSFSYEDMPKVYRSVDLFTYSTVPWESFGIVLLEAMASGIPVVATNDSIRREIIEDAGILVDPVDIDVYSKTLQLALDTNWGTKPRTQAEKFDWDKTVKSYEELFEELAKK